MNMPENMDFELISNAIRGIPEFVFIKNTEFRYVAASDMFAQQIGYRSALDILGKTDEQIIVDHAMAEKYHSIDAHILESGEDLIDAREDLCVSHSRVLYRSTSKYLVRDSQGKTIGIYGKVKDITRDVIAESRYQEETEKAFQMEEDDCFTALIDLNSWKVIRQQINAPFADLLPCDLADVDAILQCIIASGRNNSDQAADFYRKFSFDFFIDHYRRGRDYFSYKYYHSLLGGRSLWMKDTLRVRINPADSHLMILLRIHSLDETKRKEMALHRAAELDGLTGLLNRGYGQKLIEQTLSEPGGSYSIFMVDIDNFKHFNDNYGHQAGDSVLITVADILRDGFRRGDVICRLGGDEFFAFMRHGREHFCPDSRAQQLLNAIRNCHVAGVSEPITVSIGICTCPQDGETVSELYAAADKALYEAKRRGKNQFYIYDQCDE